ncbi:MAG TPA: PfkB family carbohydrate kinase, partial [Solirubrobacteraceae bacterium]|nr:PfkB family carbohydrate kinase [Solirubrobacteraceae bacterium]
MSSGAVVVVGSVNADLVVTVRQLPRAGETVSGGTFARHGGGKGANQAVAAARAGARVAFVGAVGADDLGDEALRELEAEGIDVSAVQRLDDVATGVAVIVVDERGENQIAVASGANAALTGEAVAAALAPLLAGGSAADSLGVDGAARGVVLLGHEVRPEAVAAGAAAARAAGWQAILNPAPARELIDELEGVILTPNADEARRLSGESDVNAAAQALHARTNAPVLITLGADGALLDEERFPVPSVEVVDTTGAGDAVNGALAARLAAGEPLRDAVAFALAAASLSTRSPGARA